MTSGACPRHGARRSGRSGKYAGARKRAFGWSVGWRAAAPGSLRRLAAVAGRRSGVEGRYAGSLRGQGVCSDCFGPLTRRERLLTARMVVLVLVRRLGVWGALGAHHAELPRLAHTRAMAAFAPALTPMLATPPARVFAATNMLVCVLLLLHFCSELLFPLCSGRSGRLRSCRATGAGHRNGDCGGSVGHLGELWVMV